MEVIYESLDQIEKKRSDKYPKNEYLIHKKLKNSKTNYFFAEIRNSKTFWLFCDGLKYVYL